MRVGCGLLERMDLWIGNGDGWCDLRFLCNWGRCVYFLFKKWFFIYDFEILNFDLFEFVIFVWYVCYCIIRLRIIFSFCGNMVCVGFVYIV